jgi:hypothetical protein
LAGELAQKPTFLALHPYLQMKGKGKVQGQRRFGDPGGRRG